jgi:DNA transformation protein
VTAKSDRGRFADLFHAFGPIALRRFFGGEGLFSDDVMIGFVSDERIYFKTNEQTRQAYLAEKAKPFAFDKRGETIVTGYYAIPERLYDEPEELARWARQAFDIASQSDTVKRKRRKQTALKRQPARRKRPG